MPREKEVPGSTESKASKEKELRRVYRKLKGVRSELAVKMRKLRKESSPEDYRAEDEIIVDDELETNSSENGSHADYDRTDDQTALRPPMDGAQYEVKSLIDHKNRLRKKFWRLQDEVYSKKRK